MAKQNGQLINVENCCTSGAAMIALVLLVTLANWEIGVFIAGEVREWHYAESPKAIGR